VLNEVNLHILDAARESPSEALEWEFLCECGRDDCHEQVVLTLDAYGDLHSRGAAVLAPGHRPSQTKRARTLVADAEALRRQAQHQLNRAKKNLRRSRRLQ
jgi:multidrug efflux pump subunit AcrA (membrane-fusion protein)